MRVLVVSDIHANLAAFETVLEHANGAWEEVWCLGDVVGYGPSPNRCMALLREMNHISLSGNHDWAVLGRLDLNSFNPQAQAALRWTRQTLSVETKEHLESLPSLMEKEPFTLAHASPRHPVWEYILDEGTAAVNFKHFDTPFCLVGHTHVPVTFQEVDGLGSQTLAPRYGEPLPLSEKRLILNPGSVGQPRDSDPRAAYALLDTEELTWEPRRIAYPIAVTQERMRKAGLPYRLIARLEHGW